MTIEEMATRLGLRICVGGCGLSVYRHRDGMVDPFGVVHFAERRFTRRAARRFLLLVARDQRMNDSDYLNHEMFDWWYCYHDAVNAQRLARSLGFVLPARLFNDDRRLCRSLALRRGVHLTNHPKVYAWVRGEA